MMRKMVRCVLAGLLIAVMAAPPPVATACGPFFPVTIFIQDKHPDLPLARFAAGRLGVLQPDYARSYLVVAYRYLTRRPLSKTEQQGAVRLWAKRLGREAEWLPKKKPDAAEDWLEIREQLSGAPRPQYATGDDDSWKWTSDANRYFEYANCLDDAFATASATLQKRATEFGAKSAAVQSWVAAQDAVFQNCGGGDPVRQKATVPAEAGENLPPDIRRDRAYQIAAAHFYAGEMDIARQEFLKIAADASSPWRRKAALTAVRCEVREAVLADGPNDAHLRTADEELTKLEQDPEMRELRPAIHRLQGFVAFRVRPASRGRELGELLERGRRPTEFMQNLDDYTLLLDHFVGEGREDGEDYVSPSERKELFGETTEIRGRDEMTDWILTFQSPGRDAAEHALKRWEETLGAEWLTAALAKAGPDSSEAAGLLKAAAALPENSPAYLTVTLHRARLLAEHGEEDEARKVADAALAGLPGREISARNSFRALRMSLARNLDEFLEFAPRQAALVTSDAEDRDLPEPLEWCNYGTAAAKAKCVAERSKPGPVRFDSDAARIFTESLPTGMLADAVESERLPRDLRLSVTRAAWTRAVLLGDEAMVLRLSETLEKLSPELLPLLRGYREAKAGEERQFAAIFLLLHRPEFHPYVSAGVGRQTAAGKMDAYRDNWWCSLGETKTSESSERYEPAYYGMYTPLTAPLAQLSAERNIVIPSFVKKDEEQAAAAEWDQIGAAGDAGMWLARVTLDFAKRHEDDPRVPEALHLVVRATHLSCDAVETGSYAKAAFRLLHRKYPKSEWTKRTPIYW